MNLLCVPKTSTLVAVLIAVGALLSWSAPEKAAATTSLPTTISSDQTWNPAGSVYTGSNVTINSGVTVTIDPGTVIKLTGTLTVNGTVTAAGTAADPITPRSRTTATAATPTATARRPRRLLGTGEESALPLARVASRIT